jgi:hypothetical protein
MTNLDTGKHNRLKWFLFASTLLHAYVYFMFPLDMFIQYAKVLATITFTLTVSTVLKIKTKNTPCNKSVVKALNYVFFTAFGAFVVDVINKHSVGTVGILTLTSTWIFILLLIAHLRSSCCWESSKSPTWAPQEQIDNDGIDTPNVLSERLNFADKGKSIASQIITNSQIKNKEPKSSPYQSYAILGDWGSGKSFLLSEVLKELYIKCGKDIHVIHINPWQFQTNNKSAHLTEACLQQIRDDLDRNFFIPFIHFSFHKFIHKVLPTIESTGLTSVVQHIIDLIPSHEEPRDAIQDAIKATGRHVVLIIDDIDRLSPSEAHDIFRFTRATLNFKNMSVIMCLDKERANITASDTYFQKVIHHEFIVPQVPYERLKEFIIGHIFEPKDYYKDDARIVHKKAKPFMKMTEEFLDQKFMKVLIKNVRHAKKLILTYESYKEIILATSDECKGYFHEIDLADWLCLQSIRMHSSEAYALLENSLNIERSRYQKTIKSGDKEIPAIDSMNPSEIKAHLSLQPEIQDAIDWIDSEQTQGERFYSITNSGNQSCKFNNPRYKENYFSYSKERGWTPPTKLLEAIKDKRKTKQLEQAFIELSHESDGPFRNTFQYLKEHNLLKIGAIKALYSASVSNKFNAIKHQELVLYISKGINSQNNIDFLFNSDEENLLIMAYLAVNVVEDNKRISSTKRKSLLYKILEADVPYFTDRSYFAPMRNSAHPSFRVLNAIKDINYNDHELQERLADKVVDALLNSSEQMDYVLNMESNRGHLRYVTDIRSYKPLKRLIDFMTSVELDEAKAEEYSKYFRSHSGSALEVFKERVGITADSYISLKLATTYNQTKTLAFPDSIRAKLDEVIRSVKAPAEFDISGHSTLTSSDSIEERVLKEISNEAHNIMNKKAGTDEARSQSAHDYLLKCEEVIDIIKTQIYTLAGDGESNYTTASTKKIREVFS